MSPDGSAGSVVRAGVADLCGAAENSETKFVDRVLEGWGKWARNTGIHLRTTPIGIIWRIPHEYMPGHELTLTDDGFVLVDQKIAQLPGRLAKVVHTEYRSGRCSLALRAGSVGLNRLAYRQRLLAAQWVLYAALVPDVATWMSDRTV